MGCKGSKERVPRQVDINALEPSSKNSEAPAKSASHISTALSAASTSVVGGCSLDRPTSSTSQLAATPVRSRLSSLCGGAVRHDRIEDEHQQESHNRHYSEGGAKDNLVTDSPSPGPHGVLVAYHDAVAPTNSTTPVRGAAFDSQSNVERTALERSQQQQQRHGISARDPCATEEREPSSPQSPSSLLSTLPISASPHPDSATISMGQPFLVSVREVQLQLHPSSSTRGTSDHPFRVMVADRSRHAGSGSAADAPAPPPRQGELSSLAEGDGPGSGDGVLDGTATSVNSTSFLATVPSTQLPSARASRSASLKPVPTPPQPALAVSRDPVAAVRPQAQLLQQHQTDACTPVHSPELRCQSSSPDEVVVEPIDVLSPTSMRASPRQAKTAASECAPTSIGPSMAIVDESRLPIHDGADALTQPSPAMAGCVRKLWEGMPSPPSPQQQHEELEQQRQGSSRRTRSPATSPHLRAPAALTTPTWACASAPTVSLISAMAADCSDAPHDVPLPDGEVFFCISPMHSISTSTQGMSGNVMAVSSTGSASGGGVPSPRRQSSSLCVRSPAVGPVTLKDSEGANFHSVSTMDAQARISPFATHLLSCTNSLEPANGKASRSISGSVDHIGTSRTGGGGGGSGSRGTSAHVTGTPPTNSELVRQINQPTMKIKSILRKQSSSTTTTAPSGASMTSGDGATATTLGSSGTHTRMLSRPMAYDGCTSCVSSPPDTALRTDFITKRHSHSDVDATSLLASPLPGPSPLPSANAQSPSPLSSGFVLNGGVVGASAASIGGSPSTGTTSGVEGRSGSDSSPLQKGRQGQGGDVGVGRLALSLTPAPQQLPRTPRASPPNRRGRCALTESPNSAGRNAVGDTAASPVDARAAAAGEPEGVTTFVGRTSDEPPPDIMLATPMRRVHVVV
ncbi:hypothetical protein ABL78_4533 [Leptomonas seymouri]|uniref:Uncharacterized protein n=1 Tax=Leptomonas seymouri TaxID=5684 RepID=A0A0N0P5V1_LEPSE|nr:hypothetical protein ABL78_4533 [Leptomonas seymouri]|eukprot:KPI86417.1 hypothetical protein ABL78_4533 [Leptomonas seymouri]